MPDNDFIYYLIYSELRGRVNQTGSNILQYSERALKKHPFGCFFDASGEGARRLRVLRWDEKAGAMCERSHVRTK